MDEWIPFAEGNYLAERAVLASGLGCGVELEETVIEVRENPRSGRRLLGRGRLRNAALVQLLEEGDDPDLLLDLGGEFKYRLSRPEILGGKVFASGVRSFIQFRPRQPWEQLPEAEFNALVSCLRFLSVEPG